MNEEVQLPHNIDAEQALLGAVLVNNDALHKCLGLVEEHFYDPVHARIFAAAKTLIDDGKIASPVTLKFPMQDDAGMNELGGPAYLVRLAGSSISTFAAPDYAQTIQELAARRELLAATNEACERAMTHEGGTVSEIRGDLEAKLSKTYSAGEVKPYESFMKSLMLAVDTANEAYQGGTPKGLQTGLKAFDEFMGALKPGQIYILAGRPSMGKTAVALNLANRVDGGVVFASLEMTAESLATRSISQRLREGGAAIPYRNIENGWMNENDFRQVLEAAQAIESTNMITIKPGNNELANLTSSIRAAARQIQKDGTLGMIVVDFLQLVKVKGLKSFDTIGEVTSTFKALALQYNVPIIILSQLNRGVEARDNKRPVLSDLRGSGEIEEHGDNILFCYRPAYYLEREIESITDTEERVDAEADLKNMQNDLELIVAKQKNGKIGTIRLGCEIKYNHLFDRDTQDDLAF